MTLDNSEECAAALSGRAGVKGEFREGPGAEARWVPAVGPATEGGTHSILGPWHLEKPPAQLPPSLPAFPCPSLEWGYPRNFPGRRPEVCDLPGNMTDAPVRARSIKMNHEKSSSLSEEPELFPTEIIIYIYITGIIELQAWKALGSFHPTSLSYSLES